MIDLAPQRAPTSKPQGPKQLSPKQRLDRSMRQKKAKDEFFLASKRKEPKPLHVLGRMSIKAAAREREMVKLVVLRVPYLESVLRMNQLFDMSESASTQLRVKVEKELLAFERESTSMSRQRAVQRLLGWLEEAVKDRSWTAVHGLENVIAKLQGTYEPTMVNVNVDGVIKASVEAVVSGFTAEQLEALLTTGELPGERPKKQLVQTTAEPVK